MTAPSRYADQPELDQDLQTVRQTAALERIATALEALVLAQLPASPPETAPAARELAPWDNAPMPPARPYPAQAPTAPPGVPLFRVGDVHTQGHNPIRESNKGQYCPTKLTDGTWCKWPH